MRKKLLIVAAMFVLMLPASVWADPQPPGAGWEFDHTGSITMGGSYWGYSGGPFYSTLDGKSDVPAYCVQTDVYFSPGTTYMADLYKEIGPISVSDHSSDWFWFATYAINTFGLHKSNEVDQVATQYVVWLLNHKITDFSGAPDSTRAQQILDLALDAPDNWSDAGYLYADLYTLGVTGQPIEAQDQIVPVSEVPEPMTILLLGLGLIGVAGIRRKFKS